MVVINFRNRTIEQLAEMLAGNYNCDNTTLLGCKALSKAECIECWKRTLEANEVKEGNSMIDAQMVVDDIIYSVYVIVLVLVTSVLCRNSVWRAMQRWNERRMIKQKTKLGIELESRKGKVIT